MSGSRIFPASVLLSMLFMAIVFQSIGLCVQQGMAGLKGSSQLIVVGGIGADIGGYTSGAVQIAVDAIKSRGGGTVWLTPGTFEIKSPIRLYSGISLIGSGKETILHKSDGCSSKLVGDSEHVPSRGGYKLPVEDVNGFEVGMGVQVYDNKNKSDYLQSAARITAIEGNILYVDKLREQYTAGRDGVVTNNCSAVEAIENTERVRIADFVVDGNKKTNTGFRLDGAVGGGVYLHQITDILVENVEVSNFNGDGIAWQRSQRVTIRNCNVHDCSLKGLHPGTGARGTLVEGCTLHNNEAYGIYVCQSVVGAVFRKNKVYANKQHGISIGLRDTDCTFENNHIYENAVNGVHWRDDGSRNKFFGNIVENNGTREGGYGFYLAGTNHDIVIENNIIRDTGKGFQKAGVYIGKRASNITVRQNRMSGHKEGDVIDKWSRRIQ